MTSLEALEVGTNARIDQPLQNYRADFVQFENKDLLNGYPPRTRTATERKLKSSVQHFRTWLLRFSGE